MKPGQLVSHVPGTFSISKKRQLPETLNKVYGMHAASDIIPRSFVLPSQLREWKAYMDQQAAQQQAAGSTRSPATDASAGAVADAQGALDSQSAPQPPVWILKTAQHLGKGLKLVPAGLPALKEVAARQAAAKAEAGLPPKSRLNKPFVVAQQYVHNPMLINGRKFGIRVWVVVLGPHPLRVYLHKNGLVLFSNQPYSADVLSDDKGQPGLGHVTNYAMNTHGDVWNLRMLRKHMGDEAFRSLYRQLLTSVSLTLAAALGPMQQEAHKLGLPQDGCFELLGLDFLVDDNHKPWLLEVNATPSLAVEHNDPRVCRLIHEAKNGMVTDMVQLLRLQRRFSKPYHKGLMMALMRQLRYSKAAASRRSGSSASSSSSDHAVGGDDTVSSGVGLVASGNSSVIISSSSTGRITSGTDDQLRNERSVSDEGGSSHGTVSSRSSRHNAGSDSATDSLNAHEGNSQIAVNVSNVANNTQTQHVNEKSVGSRYNIDTSQSEDEQILDMLQAQFPDAFCKPGVLETLLEVEHELRAKGGFLPLMSMMPYKSAGKGWDQLPFSDLDEMVGRWCKLREKLAKGTRSG